jgi:aquaporin Z
MNPATTLTFLRLGKVLAWDAVFDIVSQFIGGVCGMLLSKLLLGAIIAHPSVSYVTTVPGPAGAGIAFIAEAAIACGMMLMVLFVTNTPKLARFTGLFAGGLVFFYITFEAPLSGMSINPARTSASALPSGIWTSGWIYFTAPVLGMLLAAQLYRSVSNSSSGACPKLHHGTTQRCIFCGHPGETAAPVSLFTPMTGRSGWGRSATGLARAGHRRETERNGVDCSGDSTKPFPIDSPPTLRRSTDQHTLWRIPSPTSSRQSKRIMLLSPGPPRFSAGRKQTWKTCCKKPCFEHSTPIRPSGEDRLS